MGGANERLVGTIRPIGERKMANRFLRQAWAAIFVAATIVTPLAPVDTAYASAARIKDIVDIEGVRENQLVGYGLVVGLNGTGDSLNNSPFTKQSLQAMLERLGVNTRGENMRTANVAAVMVTANLPAFSTQGSRIDINVAALGDAGQSAGRHAAGDPAARRRRRGLRHRARAR
jgi:flagellar P-ring protein precursor FlgI